MDNIQYAIATVKDATVVTTYRIALLTYLSGPQPANKVEELQHMLDAYFEKAIADGTYIGVIAKNGDEIAGMGGMTIRTQPGNFKNPTGKTGYILNMYTVPAFRKKGICKQLLKMLIGLGKESGLGGFDLHASPEGEPLYQKAGFEKHDTPMYRKFGFEWPLQ